MMMILEHTIIRRPICYNKEGSIMKKLLIRPINKVKGSSTLFFSSHNRSTIVSIQQQHQTQLSQTVIYKRWNSPSISYRDSIHCRNNHKMNYPIFGIMSQIKRYQSDDAFPRKSKNESNSSSSSSSSSTMITNNNNTIRISKLIATCMCISRKEVERSIQNGEVTLYGTILKSSATIISINEIYKPNNIAAITIRGKTVPLIHNKHHFINNNNDTTLLNQNNNNDVTNNTSNDIVQHQPKKLRVWLVHKMAGELVTDIDPYNRPTVMQRIMKLGTRISKLKKHEHIKIIGRLDMNTEGLLIATNCGIYARQLELAKNMIHRTYRVRVHGRQLLPYQINAIQNGTVVIDTIKYPSMKIKYDTTRKKSTSTNQWMTITCTQGKNRQIRKILQYYNCTVTRLIRISYGDYKLHTIPKGLVQEVTNIIPYDQHVNRGRLNIAKRDPVSSKKQKQKGETTTPLPVQWLRM